MKKNHRILLILLLSVIGPFYIFLTKFYPEILWFNSFGFIKLWYFYLKSQVITFLLFFTCAFGFLYGNLWIAKKLSMAKSDQEELRFRTPFKKLNELLSQIARQRSQMTPGRQLIFRFMGLIVAVFSVLMALTAKDWWVTFFQFLHAQPFNEVDPLFNKDLSFFVFDLPFFKRLQVWMSTLILTGLGISGWIYITQNVLISIFSTAAWNKKIKRHIFSLAALFIALLAFNQWINLHELVLSRSGLVFGAGYIDTYITRQVLKFTIYGYAITAALFFIWSFRKGVIAPFLCGGLVLILNMLFGGIVPNIVHKFIVAPNELVRESPFIKHNIEMTRKAHSLNDMIETQFPANANLTANDIANNQIIMENIRLWNPEPLKDTFSQLQEIRLYYEFNDIDIDRYTVNGKMKQVMLSPRELNIDKLSTEAKNWINKHLTYTHGYGLCMSPVNQITPKGLPQFYVKDLPPSSLLDRQVQRPEIYFGEKTDQYVITNTKHKEFDYPKGDTNVYTHYQGKGGIQLSSILRRLIYSLKFSDMNILISGLIKPESRLMYDRDVMKIVGKIIPKHVMKSIHFDPDPYLVLSKEGRLIWMIDGFTFSGQYPYSQPYIGSTNYIRNSIKVTIDAYDGSTKFYLADKSDPIINTFSSIFPGIFRDLSSMPDDLIQHIRYPKFLFDIQSKVYQTYHMKDTQVFYNKEDLWSIPKETYNASEQQMKPYYMVTRLPGENKESFLLMLPYTPTNKNNMIAWLTANCDPENYGQMKVFKFPKERTIYGPMQIESRIDQDTEISQKLTLWGQKGSRVIRGNLMVIPIEDSLIYVEPIYLQAVKGKLPELKRVILAYGDQIVMEPNLDVTLQKVFKLNIDSQDVPIKSSQNASKEVEFSGLDNLRVIFSKMKSALKNLKFDEFGSLFKDMEKAIEQQGEK